MSTSSRSSAKRRASSLARSRTSPTSRSSRTASSETTSSDRSLRRLVLEDALSQRGDVPADRGQRRAQLVRDRHEEVAGELLRLRRASRSSRRSESASRSTSLPPGALRHGDVVVAGGDLVRGGRERLERPRDPAREVDDEDAGDGNPDPEGERELPRRAAASGRGAPTRGSATTSAPGEDLPERHRLRDAEIGRCRRTWKSNAGGVAGRESDSAAARSPGARGSGPASSEPPGAAGTQNTLSPPSVELEVRDARRARSPPSARRAARSRPTPPAAPKPRARACCSGRSARR